jgi:hypothetical protein
MNTRKDKRRNDKRKRREDGTVRDLLRLRSKE